MASTADPVARLRPKLHHALKTARTCIKHVRQREIARRTRMLKGKEDGGDRGEIAAIKSLKLDALAARALASKLTKQGFLPKKGLIASTDNDTLNAQFPLYNAACEEGLYTQSELVADSNIDAATTERVAHQILSAKALADELVAPLGALNALLHPEEPRKKKSEEAHGKPKKSSDASTKDTSKVEEKGHAGVVGENSNDGDDYNADDGAVDIEVADDGDDVGSDFDGDTGDAPRNWDDLVAPGSDSEDESRPVDETDDTNFLPSLATGFIPARDKDDWSDAEAEYADSGTRGPPKSMRKNRRGQRERRAIWEKKYGKNANHLKIKAKEPRAVKRQKKEHHRVIDTTNSKEKGAQHETHRGQRSADHNVREEKHQRPAPVKEHESSVAVHPSWAAKQKAKELQSNAAPQGKKITFD